MGSLAAAMLLAGTAGSAGAQSANATPTCSDVLDIDVHGEHVVGDYVSGIGHDALDWPPQGGLIGEAVSDNGGAVLPGGPGPAFHFGLGLGPGASFCTGANSGGVPRGQDD